MVDVGRILALHADAVAQWHQVEIDEPHEGVYGLVYRQHSFNFRLWHEEDKARCTKASDTEIARVKRNIDSLNQQRNDWIERVDDWIIDDLSDQGIIAPADAPRNTETPGSAIDRLSILALRLYHLDEQLARPRIAGELATSIRQKIQIGNAQRTDLANALSELLEDIYAGRKRHTTYRQMKMYNDPRLNPYLNGMAPRKAG